MRLTAIATMPPSPKATKLHGGSPDLISLICAVVRNFPAEKMREVTWRFSGSQIIDMCGWPLVLRYFHAVGLSALHPLHTTLRMTAKRATLDLRTNAAERESQFAVDH